ncbi:MAG: hypothetical protein HOJ34_08840 [Kordiimonadaceae bacterium]|jgi:tungstate transport system substrate-binding protein|nr:hypothetical protein [Kordiimonadaceae bacterium]MBT6033571.1 hypothetical protein [Kordiimonadaceae bacterium]MBT6329874.1 hypothetical protein [Kordiimonadaceae bacterium]MBT7581382.1 hypothetical protein [Kordiimonadaceae bacterium]
MKIKYLFLCAVIVAAFSYLLLAQDERPFTLMATTTTQDSGLLGILIPELEKDTGLDINVIAFGTGKVLRSAMDGNSDLIFVHDPYGEQIFMDQGHGTKRIPIMRNDFVIVGPSADPANIKNSLDAVQAFEAIFKSNSFFVSRGDDSGTHKAELRIWQKSTINPDQFIPGNYMPTGAGMGRSLNIAVEKSAYILSDHATWLTFQNKDDLSVLYENDVHLKNIYSIISVNADRHSHISAEKQNIVINWFLSNKSKQLIEDFKNKGKQLYFPLN